MHLILEAFSVIPAKAGIQYFKQILDPGVRRDDGVWKYR